MKISSSIACQPKVSFLKDVSRSVAKNNNFTVTAEGEGESKSDARQSAAKAFIYNLVGADIVQEIFEVGTNKADEAKTVQNVETHRNFVGELQNYCKFQNLPLPKYDFVSESGPPHEKTFTYRCSLNDWFEFAVGKSKKLAKHQAANAMLRFLEDRTKNLDENLTTLKETEDQLEELRNDDSPDVIEIEEEEIFQDVTVNDANRDAPMKPFDHA